MSYAHKPRSNLFKHRKVALCTHFFRKSNVRSHVLSGGGGGGSMSVSLGCSPSFPTFFLFVLQFLMHTTTQVDITLPHAYNHVRRLT